VGLDPPDSSQAHKHVADGDHRHPHVPHRRAAIPHVMFLDPAGDGIRLPRQASPAPGSASSFFKKGS